ncbi:hypothetical protein [Sporocytophaga myxococcoides]|uniref:hypothetical protein n=1 Tax=Sporocytophaga myxococcoides TaxID=153721 RepID=UPI00048C75EB|nr:hypothetical protein [Sporocytophaga myxococcoides]
MQTLGVILMVVGFIMGVFGGMFLAMPAVVADEKGGLSQEKMIKVAVLIFAGSVMILIGQYLFAGLNH